MKKGRCLKGCLNENKIMLLPQAAPLSSSRYSPYGRMRDIRGALKNFAAPIPRIETLRGDEARSGGFTLIELLVVVLIIGILAAVALPQYQKAVWKSRNAQLKTLVSSVGKAQQAYHMANGKFATHFDELGIDLPLTVSDGSECGMVAYDDSGRKGNNFEVQLYTNLPTMAWWTDGPYKCTGFAYTDDGKMWCVERGTYFTGSSGSFCKKIEKAKLDTATTVKYNTFASYFYTLPN